MNKKRKILIVLISVLVFGLVLCLDLITKHFFMGFESEQTIIPNLINFYSTKNTGAAWSMFSNSTLALTIISSVAVVLIVLYALFSKQNSIFFYISISLILSGAVGNLVDRIAFSYVRDFIQFAFFKTFPIFNFADCALTIGVVCLCLYFIIKIFKDKKQKWQLF